MDRRHFIRFISSGVVSAPVITITAMSTAMSSATVEKKPLPKMVSGQVLTSESWNNVVERINYLSENAN